MAARITPKQRRFVEEYLKDLNATTAAEKAGYSHPRQQGSRLLTYVDIQEAVRKAQERRSQRTNITQDYVLDKLKGKAESAGTKDGAAVRALELLGKHLGMFSDKVELETKGPAPIIQLVPAARDDEQAS